MTTPSAMGAMVREHLVDSGTNQRYSDTVLCRRINRAREDVARDTKCVQRSTTISIVAGTSSYSLPANYLGMKLVRIDADGDGTYEGNLTEVYIDECESVSSGNPTGWARWGMTFRMNANPTTSVTNGLKLYYYGLPDEIVLSGSSLPSTAPAVDVPSRYHGAVEYRTAEMLLYVDEEAEKAILMKRLYQEEVDRIEAQEAKDSKSDAGYVRDSYNEITGVFQ